MRKILPFLTICLTILVLASSLAVAAEPPREIEEAAYVCESFFESLDSGDYSVTWKTLSEESQQDVIFAVLAMAREGNKYKNVNYDYVQKHLAQGQGTLVTAYWKTFAEQWPMKRIIGHEFLPTPSNDPNVCLVRVEGLPEFTWSLINENGAWRFSIPKG